MKGIPHQKALRRHDGSRASRRIAASCAALGLLALSATPPAPVVLATPFALAIPDPSSSGSDKPTGYGFQANWPVPIPPEAKPKRDPKDPQQTIVGYIVQQVDIEHATGEICDPVFDPSSETMGCVPEVSHAGTDSFYEMWPVRSIPAGGTDDWVMKSSGCCLWLEMSGKMVFVPSSAIGTPEWDALTDDSWWDSQGDQGGYAPVDIPGDDDRVGVGPVGKWAKEAPPGWPSFGGVGVEVANNHAWLEWLICFGVENSVNGGPNE